MTSANQPNSNIANGIEKMKKKMQNLPLDLPAIVREKLPAAISLVITAILPFPTENTIETKQMYYVREGRGSSSTPLKPKTSS